MIEASFPRLVDSTMLTSTPCPMQFFLQWCANIAAHEKSIHLHAGGALADALHVARLSFYKHGMSRQESIFEGVRAFIEYWGDEEPPETGTGKFKDFYNTLYAFIDYCSQYNFETDMIQPYRRDNGDPAVEFTFAIPLPVEHPDNPNEPIFYGGRCDMIGVKNKLIHIVDEKTTYAFDANWSKKFNMRGQFIGYCWAAQQSGINCNWAAVRGIGIQAREIKHAEAFLHFPQWQIERWYDNMLIKVLTIIEHYKQYKSSKSLSAWPMNYGDICTSFGGCDMLDLCTSQNPEVWVGNYGKRNWNPLHKDMTKEKEIEHA